MNKIFILSFLIIASFAITDQQILQNGLNGAFEQNKLADPTTIVKCIDPDTAHKIVLFIGQLLDKAAKGSISDIIGLIDLIKKFGDQIPQSVKDCLNGNAQFQALGLKYGIDNTTDSSVIEKKVITYITLHYLQFHKWLVDLNNFWNAGKHYETGFNAAVDAHTILGLSAIPNLTDKEIIQTTLNGAFEQNKLPDPTTIVTCIDPDTAHKIVIFIGQVLDKAAKGSISDLISLKDLIQKFGDEIPQAVKDCLNGNAQFEKLGNKYGINNTTDSSVIQKKVIAYVTLHYLQVHKWFGDLDNDWHAAKYYNVGLMGATYGHSVLGLTTKDIKELRELAL